jgi:translation initiation factor 5B
VSVLGHVDHGKTTLLDHIRGSTIASKEAGGITQHIGATEIPMDVISSICGDFLEKMKIEDRLPGLFFIDTPGHEAFTTLRKRGGSLADLAILIMDINEGFKPQTYEALNILKSSKTPFVVAANKIDRIAGWNSTENASFSEVIQNQHSKVAFDLDQKLYEIVGTLHQEGFESERFDRVSNFASQITIVPISAQTGEGLPELLTMLLGLAYQYLREQLQIEEDAPASGTVLEVKEEKGLGLTIDTIL